MIAGRLTPRPVLAAVAAMAFTVLPASGATGIGEASPIGSFGFATVGLSSSTTLPTPSQPAVLPVIRHAMSAPSPMQRTGVPSPTARPSAKPTDGAVLRVAQGGADACRADRVSLRGPWGRARFDVELADDDASRAKGLMNRPEMPRRAGMLFIYPRPQRASFWMRNTLIPLDMIFADREGRVTKVHSNAIPLDETMIDGGRNVRFVLEINGGLAERYGIAPGTLLRHPAIGPSAAWPCN